MIADLDSSDTLLQSYSWGLDLSGSYAGAGGVGGLLKVENHGTGEGHHVSYDGNGNVAALVSESSGTITARYECGPFGEVIRATGTMAANNPFQFSTKFVDLESGFSYYGMRYYNPTTGRWISRDPIEEDGGLNLYGFVENDPIRHIDFVGMDCLTCGSGEPLVPRPGWEERRKRYNDCVEQCIIDNGGEWALVALGISTVAGGTVPKPFGAGFLGGGCCTTIPSLVEHFTGLGLRQLARRINPVMTATQCAAAGYLVGETVTCSTICSLDPDAH